MRTKRSKELLSSLPRRNLSDRQLFDLELLLQGAFAPLTGFLNEKDYNSVVETMHLSNGVLWPIPVVLDVEKEHPYAVGETIVLCDRFGNPIAYFTIDSIYTPDKHKEARLVYGTLDAAHSGVKYLYEETGPVYMGGAVELIAYSPKYDFRELRKSPQELRDEFKRKGYEKIVAFQTRNPIHRVHFELIRRAAKEIGAHVLLHPAVGITKEGDIDYISRVRSYKRLYDARLHDIATLAILPLAMRMTGPRSAIFHALIRKNYGATHFIVGRDHAGPGPDQTGKPFYEPYAAQELALKHEHELGITIFPIKEMMYVESEDRYVPADELKPHHVFQTLSGTKFRELLRTGKEVPSWYSFPEVIEELRKAVEKEKRRGAVIFFTGLSGAGKSTIAHILYNMLLEVQDRSVTFLDGDVVRQNLSKGLGWSKEDRDANIERIGFVANEIAKHGGIAICSAIAPYREAREKNRRLIEKNGTYIEVYVSTPQSVCEARDPKGLYKKARVGLLPHFTGVTDPYEEPKHPDIIVDMTDADSVVLVEHIIDLLRDKEIIDRV